VAENRHVFTPCVLLIRSILGGRHPVVAEVICDGIVAVAVDGIRWMFNGLAILRVELLHLDKFAVISAIVCDELRRPELAVCYRPGNPNLRQRSSALPSGETGCRSRSCRTNL